MIPLAIRPQRDVFISSDTGGMKLQDGVTPVEPGGRRMQDVMSGSIEAMKSYRRTGKGRACAELHNNSLHVYMWAATTAAPTHESLCELNR